MKRTQIYLDERQAERLDRRARATGVTRSTLIREAVDRILDEPDDEAARLARFREAVDATFGAAPTLASGEDYVDELRSGDAGRLAELERRDAQ